MEKLGFKKPDTRVHTNSNGTIINDIAYRRITVKQGIDQIDNKTITFSDGSTELFDVLPGLYLLGFFNTDTALNSIFRHQANWVREIELGNATLPDADTMMRAIRDKREWLAQHYRPTPRHHLEEESVPYIKALKKSLKQMQTS